MSAAEQGDCSALTRILDALVAHGGAVQDRGSYHAAHCPVPGHGAGRRDRNRSLTVQYIEGRPGVSGGRVRIRCHGQCDELQVIEALGFTNGFSAVYDQPRGITHPKLGRRAWEYPWRDGAGRLVGVERKFRTAEGGKTVRPGTPLPDGAGWQTRSSDDLKATPFDLPEIVAAIAKGEPVYVTEGPKDAETLQRLGHVATTNAGGADKWREQHAYWLRGAHVILCGDVDPAGGQHVRRVVDTLRPVAASIRVKQPAVGKDVTDHVEAGHTIDQLVDVVIPADDAGGDTGPEESEEEAPDPEETAIQSELRTRRRRRIAQQRLDAEFSPKPRRLGALEFLDSPEPAWLVPHLLYRDSLARIWGPPGCGKSLAVLDIALRTALGMRWAGQDIQRAPVFYVMAEGQAVNVARTKAWCEHHGIEPARLEGRFHAYPEPLQLTEAGIEHFLPDVYELEPALVILDTKNAMQVGEENSATDAAVMRRALDAIRRASGCCALLVDHSGYDNDHARGSTAVRAAMDTEIKVTSSGRSPQLITLTVDRDKAAEPGFRRVFVLEPSGRAAVLVEPSRVQDSLGDIVDLDDLAAAAATDWRTVEGVTIPDEVISYEGRGQAALQDLAHYMAHEASPEWGDPGKVGRARSEAERELKRTHDHSPSSVQRAWSALIGLKAITRAEGTRTNPGRHVWAHVVDEPEQPVEARDDP